MPAGWYPDPLAPGVIRWWDGQQWTQQVVAAQQQPMYPIPVVHTPYTMVTASHKSTSHGLHLFLTIITGGVWGVVWICMTLWHRSHKAENTVTRVGY
jgi:hypothetical protein